ncbi:EamA/RhaT family transporter [Marinomonas piezotolerans]|uniref:EamA/RhaT family transporter n=1 Tax=Marinomonas piezotolerans TaxID=2213058 RepID=A0A370U969_9GAMM|nr:DMT family transporter [Marinomonas piezotolerans]RDL44311.1 EamA/RhaT family transporter [Marinomonas piezotolerans]
MGHRSHFKAELVLLLVTIIAAFGWIFSKEALQGLPPFFFMAARFMVAGFVLCIAGRKYFHSLRWQDIKGAMTVGLVMGITMAFWVLGLDQGSSLGVGAFITSLGVILVPVFARFIFGDRPPVSIWFALPFAVLGLGCLALNGRVEFEWALLFFMAAAVSSALQFNLLSRMSTRLHVLVLTAIQLTVSGLFLAVLSALTETLPAAVPLPIFGWFLASALIATSLRFLLQTYGQSLTPASHAAVIMNLEPVWTALLAALWFSEQMLMIQIIGCVLIFLAMLISRWTQIRAIFTAN